MGSSESLPLPPPDLNRFCIFFHGTDKLLALRADQQALQVIERNVEKYGLQEKSERYGGTMCFKFKGFPFLTTSEEKGMKLKQFFCDLLSELRQEGWGLALTSCVDEALFTSCLFFEKTQPQRLELTCLGLSGQQEIHLVNLNDSQLEDGIVELLSKDWLEKQERSKEFKGILRIKLKEMLWEPENDETSNKARLIVLNIIHIFYSNGYKIYGTANPKGGNADYIFFEKQEGACGQLMFLGLNSEGNQDSIRLYNAPVSMFVVWSIPLCNKNGLGSCNGQRYSGIQFVSIQLNVFQQDTYILGGNQFCPWSKIGVNELRSKVMLTYILQALNQHGWNIESSLSLARKSKRATTFLFSQGQPNQVKFASLSPAGSSVLRVNYCSSPEIVEIIEKVIRDNWKDCNRNLFPQHSVDEISVGENFWGSVFGSDLAKQHHVLLLLFYELAKHGWQPYASASLVAKEDDMADEQPGEKFESQSEHLHTIFFRCPATDLGAIPLETLHANEKGGSLSMPSAPYFAGGAAAAGSDFAEPPPSYDEAVMNM